MEKTENSNRVVILICFLLALMIWGVFGQTLHYKFINYDDGRYVYSNPLISQGITPANVHQIFTHPHGVNWHPLTSLSHMLDCQLYGLNAGWHHGTNVLLHIATTILLFLILRQITGSLWRSAIIAALFSIHPLRVESVAWISERKDVLSGFFFMLTIGAYAQYVRRPFSLRRYTLIHIFFIFGLMSKPTLVTLPLILLLLDFWPLRRFQTLEKKKTVIKLVLEKIPLMLLTAAFCGITLWVQQDAISFAETLAIPWRIGNAIYSYAIYIQQMIFPTKLALLYPHQKTGLPLHEIGRSIILLAGISWGVWAGRKKYPYLITGWLWYLGMLAPVIGIIQVGPQAHADRYTYLPQIGLAIMAVWLTADWCASRRYHRAVLPAASVIILTSLAITAHQQTQHWQNSLSLWNHTLKCTTENSIAHNNMGGLLGQKGQFQEAIIHFEKALQISPSYADPAYNMGVILASQGKFDQAVPYLEKALTIKPTNAEWRCTLGFVFTQQANLPAAREQYKQALKIDPNCVTAQKGLKNL